MTGKGMFDPLSYFQIEKGQVTPTDVARQLAGNVSVVAYAAGNFMTGLAVRVVNRLDQNYAENVEGKNAFVLDLMETVADKAQPPMPEDRRALFMEGVRNVLQIGGPSA